MKKTISLALAAAILLAIAVVSFSGCRFEDISLDEAKSNLEGAGYTVTVMSGEEFADSEKNTYMIMSSELNNYLYAVKGSESIHMFFFVNVDIASNNYSFMNGPDGLLGGQNNSVVYFATKQARKDAKL